MILNEDYGNLNVLDKSFLYWIDYDNSWKPKKIYRNMNLKNSMVSPQSEVKVDPVKPHTLKHLLEILDQPDVAFVVFRINRKQICLITSNKIFYDNEYSSEKIVVKPSILFKSFGNEDGRPLYYNKITELKSFLNNIIKKYSEMFETTKKPVWDLLVVYKDINVSKLWSARDEAKQGYIPTPNEKEAYTKFLLDYKYAWDKKCKKYIEDNRMNNQTPEDIIKELFSRSTIKKFKFRNDIYTLDNVPLVWMHDNERENYLKYVSTDKNNPIRSIIIVFKIRGFMPKVIGIKYSDSTSDNLTDYQPLL